MHAAARHQDGAAAIAELVRNVHLFERGDDGTTVAFGNIREKDTVVGLLDPGIAGHHKRDDRRDGHHQQDFLLVAQPRQGETQTIG